MKRNIESLRHRDGQIPPDLPLHGRCMLCSACALAVSHLVDSSGEHRRKLAELDAADAAYEESERRKHTTISRK